MADEVLLERRGRVLLITLNRPDARNAINGGLTEGLVGAIEQLDGDDGLTAAVLTGAGKGFCSGMDLKAFAAGGPPRGLPRILEQGAEKPMIAAIEGFAMAGGLELALTCDLLVAAHGAKLGIPEVGVGLFAAGGGLYRLPQRLPYGVAMELALTADPITAERAFEYGLVTRLVDPGQAVDEALALAGTDRPQRPPGRGRLQAAHPRLPGLHRSRVLGDAEAADPRGLHLRGRQGGSPGLRREAGPGLERPLGRTPSGHGLARQTVDWPPARA